MAGASLWPIAGLAGVGLARAAATAVTGGLSFAAELARGIAPSDEPPKPNEPTAAEKQREQLQQRIEALAARIKQQLAEAGIDVTQPLTLTSDGLGGIAAADHPQRAAIDELLGSDYLLLRDFDRLKDDSDALADISGQGPGAAEFCVTISAGHSSAGG